MTKRVSQRLLAAAFLFITLTATGCVGTRLGVSWAGLALVGEEQNILVSHNDMMILVNPNGEKVPLLNNEGQERLDENGEPRLWDLRPGEQGVTAPQFFGKPLLLDETKLLAADYQNKKLIEIDFSAARIDNPGGIEIGGKVLTDLISDGERIFLPYDTQNLQAFDLENRDVVWTFETKNGIWSTPLLHEGTLYFTSMDHMLYAVDAESGEQRWAFDLGGAAAASPTLSNDRIYVGSFANKIFEISLDGEKLGEYTTANWVWGAPVVQDDIVYTADLSGFVYALEADGLKEIWKQKTTTVKGIRPSPLVTDEYVIIASRDGHVEWLNRETGALVYDRFLDAEILSDIILIEPNETSDIPDEPLVVVSTFAADKLLVAYSLDEAGQQWTYQR